MTTLIISALLVEKAGAAPFQARPSNPQSIVIVRALSAAAATQRVQSVGGEILHVLDAIRSVEARVSAEQLAALRRLPGIRICADSWITGAD